jgi:uncharacterized protein (DUF1697 family)
MRCARKSPRDSAVDLGSLQTKGMSHGFGMLGGYSVIERSETLPAYIAMLRGINVSGQKAIRMERLRESCGALGFRSIETYVQSGNVVFVEGPKLASSLSKDIGQAVLHDFGFDVTVLVRTSTEMRDLIQRNPFLKERGVDPSRLYVTFLSEAPSKKVLKNADGLSSEPDRFHIGRQEIYLYCPGGYGKTKLSNTAFEKALSVRATTRNWKTVNALFEMASKLNGNS